MPTTFDLSDTGAPAPGPMRPNSSKPDSSWELPEGVANVLRFVVWAAVFCGGSVLIYLSWGLISGFWANQHYMSAGHDDRQRFLDNIAGCGTVLKISSIVFLVAFLALNFADSAIGYVLLGMGAMLYFGLPFIASELLGFQNLSSSKATDAAEGVMQSTALFYAIPGIIWTLYDFIRRMQGAAEKSAIQRANVRYGSSVQRQTHKKQRNVFLGRCWELAYCRDNVRVKCPIFKRKKGPCWWYKQGCMCDERIVLQAVIDSDWKEKQSAGLGGVQPPAGSKSTDLSLQGNMVQQPYLSMAKKIERCKSCVIYNEHQRQKYHAMVVVAFIIFPALIFFNSDAVEKGVDVTLNGFQALTQRLSFTGASDTPSLTTSDYSSSLEWLLVAAAFVIFMSQVLRLIEYICFKLKI